MIDSYATEIKKPSMKSGWQLLFDKLGIKEKKMSNTPQLVMSPSILSPFCPRAKIRVDNVPPFASILSPAYICCGNRYPMCHAQHLHPSLRGLAK